RTWVVTSIVKFVFNVSGLIGVSVTARSPSLNALVVGTAAPLFVNRHDPDVTLARSIGSENRTTTAASGSTEAAPAAGVSSTMSGDTTSRTLTVTAAELA